MKQEKFENIGQWKHTQVENPEWNKQALSWPITADGQFNDNYDWPMEGYLIAYAPPTKGGGEADKPDQSAKSLRLQVLKNGADNHCKPVSIVAPVCLLWSSSSSSSPFIDKLTCATHLQW